MATTRTSATYCPESGMSSRKWDVIYTAEKTCLHLLPAWNKWLPITSDSTSVPLQYSSPEDGGQNGLKILLCVSGAISDFIQKDCCP